MGSGPFPNNTEGLFDLCWDSPLTQASNISKCREVCARIGGKGVRRRPLNNRLTCLKM